jgi:hypothetical protein
MKVITVYVEMNKRLGVLVLGTPLDESVFINYADFVAGSWDKSARIWLNRKCTMTLTGKIFHIVLFCIKMR